MGLFKRLREEFYLTGYTEARSCCLKSHRFISGLLVKTILEINKFSSLRETPRYSVVNLLNSSLRETPRTPWLFFLILPLCPRASVRDNLLPLRFNFFALLQSSHLRSAGVLRGSRRFFSAMTGQGRRQALPRWTLFQF